jgi:hypothetical protein
MEEVDFGSVIQSRRILSEQKRIQNPEIVFNYTS